MTNKRYLSALVSVVIVVAIFAAGFYTGERQISSAKPSFILNGDANTKADMAPFWKAWNILDEKFAPAATTTKPVASQDKIWGAVEGLAASYGDPYTVFFPPVESKAFEEEISGSFGGVGMEIAVQDSTLTVVSPIKGTPAYNAGVKPGDKVLAIDDKPALNMNTDEAIKLIRGEAGTKVKITFARKGVDQPIVKEIVRAAIEIPTVNTRVVGNDVFVIELYNFSAISPGAFRKALREFIESGKPNLVLDLRNNPGGYLEAALDMASWFLPTGKVVVTEDFGGKRENVVYKSKGYDVFNEKLKFVILINEGSASASEILAGALSQHGKATLIGQKSFGKGSVQELVPVTDNTSLKVTVAHWLTPNGTSISKNGIMPQVEVKITSENTKDGKDPTMDAAVKFLHSQ